VIARVISCDSRRICRGKPHSALADFVARSIGRARLFGAFAVSAGEGIEEPLRRFEPPTMIIRPSCSKCWPIAWPRRSPSAARTVRREFWAMRGEKLGSEQLIREEYRGFARRRVIRRARSHGEARCSSCSTCSSGPYHADGILCDVPTAAVSGWYFRIRIRATCGRRIDRDQVEDYARRKGLGVEEVERWLAPISATNLRSPNCRSRERTLSTARSRQRIPPAGCCAASSAYSATAVARCIWCGHNPALLAALAGLTVMAGLLPAAVAFIGAQIVDAS